MPLPDGTGKLKPVSISALATRAITAGKLVQKKRRERNFGRVEIIKYWGAYVSFEKNNEL